VRQGENHRKFRTTPDEFLTHDKSKQGYPATTEYVYRATCGLIGATLWGCLTVLPTYDLILHPSCNGM
jgi:hypothetical protein